MEVRGSGAEPLEAADPRRIGAIPLLGKLGAGGMGRVYLGVVDGRYAAVKQVLPHFAEDENFLRHFGHELDNLSRLPDEVTAPLLASDRQARPPWFATAYIPGLTLTEAMALHGGPLPLQALWLLLREAAAGLRVVHALDMVHRDLKPSNVMLTRGGATLIDFGVARAADQSRLTGTGVVVGTPAYMSPEQATAAQQLTGATDVFALGALLGYAAVGQPPFGDGSGVDVLYRIVHGEPDLEGLRALDPELAEAVRSCLDKNPLERPTAERLFQLAARKTALTRPGWPAPVMERLAERAAFAARATPRITLEREPTQLDQATPGVVRIAPVAAAERPRRRPRLLLAMVPIVLVAGTTIGVQLLPKLTSPRTAESGPSASGPAGTGPAASASAGSPSASTSPTGLPPVSGTPSVPPSGQTGGPAGGTGGTGSNGPGGTGSTSGTGTSGGSNTSGGQSSKPTAAPSTSAPSHGSSYYALKNGSSGTCLQVTSFANNLTLDLGSCSGSAALWSFKSVSGGGSQVVNKATGKCLQAGMFNNKSTVGDCGQGGLTSWYSGSNSSLADQYDGNCLDLAFGGGATTAKCSGSAAQQWKRQ